MALSHLLDKTRAPDHASHIELYVHQQHFIFMTTDILSVFASDRVTKEIQVPPVLWNILMEVVSEVRLQEKHFSNWLSSIIH